MKRSNKNLFNLLPFSRLMHPADASTLLRNMQQVIELTGRAWCGVSLTERGTVTRNRVNLKRSTPNPFPSIPLKPFREVGGKPLTELSLGCFPSFFHAKKTGGNPQ